MIQTLSIKNFARFSENDFNFSAGINVIIGQNSIGKTHLLKLLSASLSAIEHGQTENIETTLANRLTGYFRPEALGRLVRRQQGRNKAEISLQADEGSLQYSFTSVSKTVKVSRNTFSQACKTLYLPSREVISIFEGFISLFQNREVSFDETYYRLALALDLPLLKGRRFEEVQTWIAPFEEITGSKVIKDNGRFYLQNEQGRMEMTLVAEGYRKIATLMYLMANGELSQNSILFWDEPEANLNPKLTKQVAEFLVTLALKGVQVFVATHDYLFTNLLSLQSEYKDALSERTPDIRFFGLYEQDKQVVFDYGDSLATLSQNPILEEFTALYDREQRYFNLAKF